MMNKIVISILIWLVCMPCMVAAETSKELEEAIKKCKKETNALFDTNETEAYTKLAKRLMDLCLEANDEELYYKAWSNLATFTSRQNPLKGLKVADEMRDYAKKHDSKYGFVIALYTQANLSVKVGMTDRAAELCQQAIEYKNQYLPEINCTHIYWMLAKIYLVKQERKNAIDALNRSLKEPNLTSYERMNVLAYKCEAAFCEEPVDTSLFMTNYTELQRLMKETGRTSEFFMSQDIHYADVTGQYDKMLELARQKPNKIVRYEYIYKVYMKMGRWKEAFDALQLYVFARDSVRTDETRKQIEMSSLELEAARAENEAQTLRMEKQQLTFGGVAVGILALVIFFGLYLWSRHRAAMRLAEVKAEQERIQSELHIAREIQMSMVPAVFPKLEGLDMSAFMNPAKEVGGDLYDYFIRDEKLFFCIGDVSGKGVPSAMVMSVILSMFRAFSAHENNPAHIMQAVNEASCRGNDSNMFVTIFIGVLDLPTGRLRYCDAGHDAPMVMTEGKWVMLDVIPHLPVGVFEDVKYGMQETQMNPDSTIFLYTDGLTEAKNHKRKQFGINRVGEVLAANSQLPPQQLLKAITNKVHEFVGDAEQSDDLTMMAVHYTPKRFESTQTETLLIKNDVHEMSKFSTFMKSVLEKLDIEESLAHQLCLAVEEAVVNVIDYAYPAGQDGDIEICVMSDGETLKTIITDSGVAFDPTAKEKADTSLSVEDRQIGGLGILLIRELMDAINYERENGKNILTLIKNI